MEVKVHVFLHMIVNFLTYKAYIVGRVSLVAMISGVDC